MIVVYCDRCKKQLEGLWDVRVIVHKWKDDSGGDLAEICSQCNIELEAWVGKPRKKWETGYKPVVDDTKEGNK